MTGTQDIRLPLLLGVGLGAAAFAADLLPREAAQVVTPLVSSGFSWGLAALVAGLRTRERGLAVKAGVVTLVTATFAYYCLSLVTSPRWDLAPEDVENGQTGAPAVLASIAPALVLWLAFALCGGVVMGLLAHVIAHGSARQASLAAGVAFGLLAGEGAYTLLHMVLVWAAPIDAFAWGRILAGSEQLLLAASATTLIVVCRKKGRSWPEFFIAATVSATVGVFFWHAVKSASFHV